MTGICRKILKKDMWYGSFVARRQGAQADMRFSTPSMSSKRLPIFVVAHFRIKDFSIRSHLVLIVLLSAIAVLTGACSVVVR